MNLFVSKIVFFSLLKVVKFEISNKMSHLIRIASFSSLSSANKFRCELFLHYADNEFVKYGYSNLNLSRNIENLRSLRFH